mgnify:FL=1
MKTRVIVGAVAIPLIVLVIFFAPLWVLGGLLGAVAAIGAWELLRCVQPDLPIRMVVYAAVAAFVLPLFTSMGHYALVERLTLWGLVVVMFCELMLTFRKEERMDFSQVMLVVFAGFVLPMLFTTLVRLRMMEHGSVFVLLPFVVAFSSDSGAYFAGLYLGKHKLAPALSPKKTIEGSVGGFAAAILLCLVYGGILKAFDLNVNFLVLGIYGFLGSLVGQLGDLSFSAIKRLHGVKDYSHVIPGHGGILDRFDSMLFIAPLMELLLMWVPAIM